MPYFKLSSGPIGINRYDLMGNIIKKQGEYIMDQQQTERLVEHILDQMKEMLKRYGFQAVMIRGVCNYQKEALYCIPQYLSLIHI